MERMFQRRHSGWWIGVLALSIVVLGGCGALSSDATSSGDSSTVSEEAAAADATFTAIGSATDAYDAWSAGEVAALHVDGHADDGGQGEGEPGEFDDDEGTAPSDGTNSDPASPTSVCTDGGNNQVTCPCEGGVGSITYVFGPTSGTRETTGTFDATFQTQMSGCAVVGCDRNQRIVDGAVSGSLSVVYRDVTTRDRQITFQHRTSGSCSGLTVDGKTIGFDIMESISAVGEQWDETQLTRSGSICLDPLIGPVPFTDPTQLRDLFDPTGICLARGP